MFFGNFTVENATADSTVDVDVDIQLFWLNQVDLSENVYTGLFSVRLRWNDYRNGWNSSVLGKVVQGTQLRVKLLGRG